MRQQPKIVQIIHQISMKHCYNNKSCKGCMYYTGAYCMTSYNDQNKLYNEPNIYYDQNDFDHTIKGIKL